MIDTVIRYSIRNKLVVFLLTALGCLLGYRCLRAMHLDALPDQGDTQVILYSTWDRSADVMESQVTYPIVTAVLGTPHVKSVRGVSDFGSSFVYIIFDDNTDIYWARSRVVEYLSEVRGRLPEGVKTELGPDATSLGWIYQYVVTDITGRNNLAELRTYQDWHLRYALKAVPGVAEVASIGGFRRECQVNLDPGLLQRYGISLRQVIDAVRAGNEETSGRMLDFGGTEYMVRGQGSAKTLDDFRAIVVNAPTQGLPVRIADLGQVVWGPDLRRGIIDLDGDGDVVSGIVVMRNGENALQVIGKVKARLKAMEPGMPPGITVTPIYDRSGLILRTISNARWTIAEVLLTVVLIILVFLWHFPSALIPLVTMPVAVLLAFIPLKLIGVGANVMSLAGVAIAFGELIDASIIIVEQTHKRLEQWQAAGSRGRQSDVVLGAIREVAGPSFFALLVIAVSLLPVLMLEGQEGRMFRPLAYSKSFAVMAAALLVVTLDPALRMLLAGTRRVNWKSSWLSNVANALFVGRIRAEEKHPVSGFLIRWYAPIVRSALAHKWLVLGFAGLLMLVTIPAYLAIGSEYLPTINEGAILYMPSTMPGISVTQAQSLLQATDSILKRFPEVDHVLGKAGRADTATDPAPLSMLETLITLRPRSEWRHIDTWYSSWAPEWIKTALRHITPDTISLEEVQAEMNSVLKVPGLANAWTMPIRGRTEMLTTGIRTPIGIKLSGQDPKVIEEIGRRVQTILPSVRGTRGVFAEQINQGYSLDIAWKRYQLARYGITIEQAQQVVNSAIGGENVTTIIDGVERFPVNVRYLPEFRQSVEAIASTLVSSNGHQLTPLRELADVSIHQSPSMLRDENGMLTGYVYVDTANRDVGSFVKDADRVLRDKLHLPPGYVLEWAGQYESMQRVNRRLKIVIPATILLVALLIYFSTQSFAKTMIVLLAVPFSAIGAIWLLFLLHYNMSVAVWVGLISLLSIDAETGVFMLLYLDLAYEEARRDGRLNTISDLRGAIVQGAAKRIRPKFMTFATTCIGLFPVMWSTGAGAEVVKRIAAPMVGGILTSFLLELLVYPVVYELWRRGSLDHGGANDSQEAAPADHALAFSTQGS